MTARADLIASAARRTASSLHLSIHCQSRLPCGSFLRKHLQAAHRLLGPPLGELSLAVVDDTRMSVLHEQFLQIPGTTDVLTFPLDLDEAGRPLSGEIVVCVDEAQRQADARGRRVSEELLLYSLHGMLHLCGFDDKTQSAYRQMHRKEDQILRQLGVGPVFSDPPRPARPGPRTHAGAAARRRSRRRTPGAR